MATLTHDMAKDRASRTQVGLALAIVSAASFGMSGPIARGLLDAGWSPGLVVLGRICVGAVVLAPFALRALAGRYAALRRNLPVVTLYGLLAVAGAQFCYYSAVQFMQVGPAILIEYAAPAAVVLWMWLRHGQRPGPVTLLGAALAALGLLLVLDILGGTSISTTGVLWALGAMVGCAVYFIVNADDTSGLPPLALAWSGLVVGGAFLALLGLIGLLPLRAGSGEVALAGATTPWWVPMLLLGVVAAAVAYGTGVAAGRLLGSQLASFVGLLEVVASVVFAWLLLGELPGLVQLVGGLLILAGVVAVKLGEARQPGPDATTSELPVTT